MDTFLTISEAAKMLQVDIQVLNQLVKSGNIKSSMLSTSGVVLVREQDIRSRVPITQRPEYTRYAHLSGTLINLTEVRVKYGIAQGTVSRWIVRGIITKAGNEGKAVLVDEAEIATCAEIYRTAGGRQGIHLFDTQ